MSSKTPRASMPSRPPGGRDVPGPRLRVPSSPASAREIFGRFVRTLEELDAARASPAAREQKADTTQTWEVSGCGKN